jgi:hypothetical protein
MCLLYIWIFYLINIDSIGRFYDEHGDFNFAIANFSY